MIPNLTPNFALNWNPTEDVAFQPDGKILVAGSAYDTRVGFDFTVTRFNHDGSLDSSFANNGVFRHDFFQNDDTGWGVALQPDGKIIVAGEVYLGVVRSNFLCRSYFAASDAAQGACENRLRRIANRGRCE